MAKKKSTISEIDARINTVYKHAELERPEWLHESLSALKDIQRKATTRQQYSTALKAIEMQARLLRFEMS